MPSSQAKKIQEGTQCIRWWYDASGLQFTGVSFDQAVYALTADPGNPLWLYPENLGEAFEAVGNARAQDAMTTLGNLNQGKIPTSEAFFNVMVNAVDPHNITNFLSIVGNAVKDTGEEITTTVANKASFALNTTYWIALAGIALFVGLYAVSSAKRFS
jgi:hypothetical protein